MPASGIRSAGNAGKAGRAVYSSQIQATLVLNAVASDESLPSVTVPSSFVPKGTTIRRVTAAISWRKGVESSGSANAVNVAQNIQVRSDAPGTWRDAIPIPDNALAHAADATEPGSLILGNTDIKVEVTGADIYEFQWENSDVDGASITLHDVQTHLIIDFG